MRFIFLLVYIGSSIGLYAQNCKAYLYKGDTCYYEACVLSKDRAGHYQYAARYHKALDRAIEKCDRYPHAYRNKSVAYLKSGDFITWKKLIDKAVDLDPIDNLGYRGWCRYQFFRDYEGAIADIERLDSLIDYDISTSAGGEYHLHIARALCYKALGKADKAIDIIETQLADSEYSAGMYDYLHLGVLYLELESFEKAERAFRAQAEVNNIAEVQFYTGQMYRTLDQKEKAHKHFDAALRLYDSDNRMYDPYTEQMDKIYRQQILASLSQL